MNETSYPSPNFLARATHPITMIILHDTEGSAQGALSWFAQKESQVSAHILIDKEGQIYRCVDDDKIAWHVRGHNMMSLGVELELLKGDPDGAYTIEQLASCAEWVAEKCIQYNIPLNRIVSHASLDPARRTDPRGLDWFQFLLDVATFIETKLP